jgi:hypothetical protein
MANIVNISEKNKLLIQDNANNLINNEKKEQIQMILAPLAISNAKLLFYIEV